MTDIVRDLEERYYFEPLKRTFLNNIYGYNKL